MSAPARSSRCCGRASASRCRATSARYLEDCPPRRSPPSPRRSGSCAPRARSPGSSWSTVGPLTNLARALALDPELPRRVAGLTVMGGHIREVRIGEHVCAPGVDYNLCSDPEASVAVLGAGFRTTLVTADVTLSDLDGHGRRREVRAGGAAGARARGQIRIWTPVQQKIFTELGGTLAPDNAAFLHDPLTVLALIDAAPLALRVAPDRDHHRARRAAHARAAGGRRGRRADARRDVGGCGTGGPRDRRPDRVSLRAQERGASPTRSGVTPRASSPGAPRSARRRSPSARAGRRRSRRARRSRRRRRPVGARPPP